MNEYKISWAIDSLEVRTDIIIEKGDIKMNFTVNLVLDTDEIQSFARGMVRSWETSIVNDWDIRVVDWEGD